MTYNFLQKNNIHIYLLALLPLLSLFMVSMAILIFVLVSTLNFLHSRHKAGDRKRTLKIILLYSTPFFLYIISLIWSDNLGEGLGYIAKITSFLILPITIFVLRPFKTFLQIKIFNKVFIIASALFVFITIIFILINIQDIVSQQSDYLMNMRLRQKIDLVPIIGEHPIYFSLLLAVALLLLFYNRFKSWVLNIIVLLFLVLGLLIASSRGVILAISIVSILIIFQQSKNILRAFVFFGLLLAGLVTVTYFSPIKERVTEILENKYTYPEGVHYNSFNMRMAIYNCSFSLIENVPFIGFAPADVQRELNQCYKKYSTSVFDNKNYNTHNQYLDYYFSFGIIGFIIILYSFTYYLKIAIKNKHKHYLNFLILFYIVFLTENVLIRNTGIVLFTTFNCLFAYLILFNSELE